MNFFRTLFFILIFSISATAQQNWLWSNGGVGNDEALDNTTDQNGNIFTTGYFSLTAQFNSITLTSNGSGDIFVSKQDSNGVYQWVTQAGGTGSDRAYGIATDNAGNVFIAGFFSETATFGSITLTSSNNSLDVFVAKLDVSGNFLWAKKFGGSDIDLGLAVNTDANGNVIITGQFKGAAQFGTNTFTSMTDPTSNLPSYDIFILKSDANGNFLWSKHGAAKYDDRGLSVSSDNSGNIYVSGQFSDTLYFGNTYNNNAFNAGFLLKLDPSGNEVWMRRMFATLVTAYSVQCYANDIYVTGDFQGNLTISGTTQTSVSSIYPYNIFVSKLDNNGNVLWIEHNGSDNNVSSLDIAVDASGDAYIAGLFSCVFSEYSSFYGEGIFSSAGFRDVYVSKISISGQLMWERQFGGSRDDFCSAISVIAKDEPVIAGSFERGFNVPKGSNFVQNISNFDSSNYGPVQPMPYCNDYNYRRYISVSSLGSKDIFSAQPFDLARNTYDCFDRTAGPCVYGIAQPFIYGPYISYANLDTIFSCKTVYLAVRFRTGTEGVIGPEYSYQWSTGATTSNINATTSGYYSVQVSFKDQCQTFFDSVYVEIEPSPAIPTITASEGTIQNTSPTDSCSLKLIQVDPSIGMLYGGNITPGYIYYWKTPGGTIVYSDSIPAVPPGFYIFNVMSPHDSCISKKCIEVITLDTSTAGQCVHIPLMLVLADSIFEATDTVRVCKNSIFQMMVTDSASYANNVLLHLPMFISWFIDYGGISFYNVSSVPVFTFDTHIQSFQANSSGNCSVTITGYNPKDNTQCISVTRTFYLEVLPLPVDTVQINGLHFFCPGDSVVLTISGASSNQVVGPGVVYISPGGDTIYVNETGTYIIHYDLIDTVTGCQVSGSKSFVVSTTPSPLVTVIPSNGVICPGDSVQLIAQSGLSYNWIGPLGNNIGTGQSIYVHTPGYYHYEFIDSSGCELLSEFKEVKAYTTPYLNANPVPMLCPGGSVIISVFTVDTTQIQWLPPLSGNSSSQVVTAPGTYYCSVTVCGINTIASLTITESNINAAISASSSVVICNGEPITLTAISGFSGYNWQPVNQNTQSISVMQPGMYYLFVTDTNQCSANDSINVTAHQLSIPSATGDTACKGETAELFASASGVIKWYDSISATAPVGTGSPFITPPVITDFIYYSANTDSVCQSAKIPAQVIVKICGPVIPNVFTPNDDGSNDAFTITYEGAKSMRLIIYNRWGQEIIRLEGTSVVSWNGRDSDGDKMPQSTYYYILDVINYKDIAEKYSGFVELIR
jgi:gliding motility-associated-like protein